MKIMARRFSEMRRRVYTINMVKVDLGVVIQRMDTAGNLMKIIAAMECCQHYTKTDQVMFIISTIICILLILQLLLHIILLLNTVLHRRIHTISVGSSKSDIWSCKLPKRNCCKSNSNSGRKMMVCIGYYRIVNFEYPKLLRRMLCSSNNMNMVRMIHIRVFHSTSSSISSSISDRCCVMIIQGML